MSKDPSPLQVNVLAAMWEMTVTSPPWKGATGPDPELYPIRVLTQDVETSVVTSNGRFFFDKHSDTHGHSNLPWPFDKLTKVEKPADALLPRLLLSVFVSADKSKVKLSFEPPPSASTRSASADIEFDAARQVVISPIPGDKENWPSLSELNALEFDNLRWPNDTVDLPPSRLVLGDLTGSLEPKHKLAALLRNIGADTEKVRFTPDGLVLKCDVPFPGSGTLGGTFLLHPVMTNEKGDTGLRLRLLAEELDADQRAAWSKAWLAISPAVIPDSSLRIIARRSEVPPAFVWSVRWKDKTTWVLGENVTIPQDWMRASLIGRRTDSTTSEHDGAARLIAGVMTVASVAESSTVVLKASRGTAKNAQLKLSKNKESVPDEELVIEPANGDKIELRHDARELSSTLHAIQGADRKVLHGFVAADRGWLQLPLPDVPPLDPELDQHVAREPRDEVPSVIDGFVRWSASATRELVTATRLDAIDLVARAPWSLTVEEANGFVLTAVLQPGAQEAKLLTWSVELLDPEVSTRGLLWLSGDRPDGDEALPRLGAGPGTFFDVPFEIDGASNQDGAARFFLSRLELDPRKADLGTRAMSMRWEPADENNPKSWAWLRHERLPLAATMSMTRSGGESTRPLESRDLAPFVVTDAATALRFESGNALAQAGTLTVKRLDHWPWADKAEEPRGVAFAAVGVPGAEVQPRDGDGRAWSEIELAYRYDLPLLDEAFASARLPKKEEDLPRQTPLPDPSITALDRDAIKEFWNDRARKQELSRVQDSYLLTFDDQTGATNLIATAKWEVSATLAMPAANAALPYGQVDLIDGSEPLIHLTGDAALAGVDATFRRDGALLKRDKAAGTLEVRGFSPSTYDDGALKADNRGFASGDDVDGVRKVVVLGKPYTLLTRLEPIEIAIGNRRLELWLKDLPIGANGAFEGLLAVDPNAWDPKVAPIGGYEVRLFDRSQPGEDRIRIWGFDLQFLGVRKATFNALVLETAELSCRLQLPASKDPLGHGGHELLLHVKRDGNKWILEKLTVVQSPPVVLRSRKLNRLMKLTFSPSLSGAKLKLIGAVLDLTLFGAEWSFPLEPIEIAPDDASFTLKWKKPGPPAAETIEGFVGRLDPTKAELTIDANEATLDFESELRIENEKRVTLAKLPLVGKSDEKLDVFGFTVPTESGDDPDGLEISGALVRRLRPTVEGTLFEGLPASADRTASGLLAVTFENRANGSAEPLRVIAGHLELDVSSPPADADKPGVAMRSVRIALSANARKQGAPDPRWSGHVELYGTMRLDSAIRWPAAWEVDASSSNTTKVRTLPVAENEQFISHRATFHLEGHVLPLDDFAAEGPDKPLNRIAGAWHTLALASHELRRKTANGERMLAWSSLEPFGLMTLAELALVQKNTVLGKNPPHVEAAFVAGHRVRPGTPAQNAKALVPVWGIFKPGFGRRADVLAGADSRPFREALGNELNARPALKKELIAIAGFAGVVIPPGLRVAERLLRVPFLSRLHGVGIDPPTDLLGVNALTQLPDAGVKTEMPRHDTTLAPKLAISARHAVTPASTRAESLWDLLLPGSRRAAAETEDSERTEAAVLAEQAFVAGFFGANAPLTKTPFWIGAALVIAELMKDAGDGGTRRALSLISGSVSKKDEATRPVSAVVALDFAGARNLVVPPLPSALITIGDDLVLAPFTAREGAPSALVRAAAARHAVPRVVVLRAAGAYGIAPVPPPVIAELPQPGLFAGARAVFPQAQRGYARAPFASPKSAAGFAWSSGILQGHTQAIFDRGKSGVAGLATSAALPRYSQPLDPDAADVKTSPLAWLGEKRSAPYLPLKLDDFDAPPFGWLTVAPPRARLPIASEVKSALEKSGIAEPADGRTTRALLPESIALASVSERAGVLTARRVQLLAQVPGTEPFDPSFARFGVAAQASGAPLRQVRTPRPGPLPTSRRPRASKLQTEKIARFVRGSAESVSGLNESASWCVLIAAMPSTEGIVSNRWDGSVRLRCEITFDKDVPNTTNPLRWLFAVKDAGAKQLRAIAWITIGKVVIPLINARFETIAQQDPRLRVADVVLDLDRKATEVLPQAVALDAVPPPPVALHVLVHPDRDEAGDLAVAGNVWTLSQPNEDELPGGPERLPVTLHWPLASVSTDRGALPLRPVSIAFGDPAYDDELTSEPLDARDTVAAGGNAPSNRGRLQAMLAIDRRAAEIDANIAIMADLRFERRPPNGQPDEDDLDMTPETRPLLFLRARVIPKIGKARDLWITPHVERGKIRLGFVHELSLAALREADKEKTPVSWAPGDRLSLSMTPVEPSGTMAVKLRAENGPIDVTVTLDPKAPLTVSVPVTAEPSFEPPSALYGVMRKTSTQPTALSIPLFAQSPQPTRVDSAELRKDFMRGLIHRQATFLWRTAWPIPGTAGAKPSIYVFKQDRNGQTHLPETAKELENLESPLEWQ